MDIVLCHSSCVSFSWCMDVREPIENCECPVVASPSPRRYGQIEAMKSPIHSMIAPWASSYLTGSRARKTGNLTSATIAKVLGGISSRCRYNLQETWEDQESVARRYAIRLANGPAGQHIHRLFTKASTPANHFFQVSPSPRLRIRFIREYPLTDSSSSSLLTRY